MTRNSLRRPASRRRLSVCLILCCSLGLQLLVPSRRPAAATMDPASSVARKQQAAALNLPNLNELRRRGAESPRAVPPVPSMRGACGAGDALCQAVSAGAPRLPVEGHGTLARLAASSFPALAAAALNGGRPVIGLSPLDFFLGGGYAVSDAPDFRLPVAAAPVLDAPSNLRVIAAANSHVDLAWDPAAGATNYRVEWSASKGATPQLLGTTTNTSTSHGGLTRGHSYLYRVCAADGAGSCVSAYGNVAMGTAYAFEDDPIVTAAADPSGVTVTKIRALHVTELREAVDSVRALVPGLGGGSWTNETLTPQVSLIKADDVRDLRGELGEALSALGLDAPAYTDPVIYSPQDAGHSPTTVKGAHVTELRLAATRGRGAGPAFDPAYDFDTSRLDPVNRTGGGGADAYSRNYNWSLPLVSLPGRAGLDLGLTLSYNSLVWTKDTAGAAVTFDADRGFPAPGFRLGFPKIQHSFINPQTGRAIYLLITPSGARVELRQTDVAGVYESADSSYLQLKDDGGALELVSTDGMRLTFALISGEYHCVEVKDVDGNYLTVSRNGFGQIATIVDTLGRTVTFDYDSFQNLQSITQTWKRETEADPNPPDETHVWATFGFGEPLTLGTNQQLFGNLVIVGTQGGTQIPVLRQVGLADGTFYKFHYTHYGQVWKVEHHAADSTTLEPHVLSYTAYNLPGSPIGASAAQEDAPRFTEARAWAEYAVNDQQQSQEALTTYSTWAANLASCDITAPDGLTVFREIYATSADGWKKGLITRSEVRHAGVPKKWTTLTWTQDDTTVSYRLNPRVTETLVEDAEQNKRRTTVSYAPVSEFSLPREVVEYKDDTTTPLRTTVTEYNLGSEYISRRIIGLPRFTYLYDGTVSQANLRSKVGYVYDDDTLAGYLQPLTSAATQHYDSYGTSFRWRGNVNRVRRYEVNQQTGIESGSFAERQTGYNGAGSPVFARDAAGHQVTLSYTDSFYENVNRSNPGLQTFAYPTSLTTHETVPVPLDIITTTQYNYDLGAVVKTRVPKGGVAGFEPGPEMKRLYDAAGRVKKVVNVLTTAHTEWVYPETSNIVQTFTTVNDASLTDPTLRAYAATVFTGDGKVRGRAQDFLGSTGPEPRGNYAGVRTVYDVMGRPVQQSNPTEMLTSGTMAQGTWTPAGDDANGGVWRTVQQQYDWQGRPTITTNVDGTTREVVYGGCGCAGGELVTTKGEALPQGRRQQKVYHDVLGRAWKTEVLNWNGTVYTTTTTRYNALDQAVRVREYQGVAPATEPGGEGIGYQTTTSEYDGHGRLWKRHTPEQDAGRNTVFTYYPDDTLASVTDARGAKATQTYNARQLVTRIHYDTSEVIAEQNVDAASDVVFTYDAAGNRKMMTDGAGYVEYGFDQFSRLTSETRYLAGPNRSYQMGYVYNPAGQLTGLSDADSGASFSYQRDTTGRLTALTDAPSAGVNSYVSNVSYRAWGAVKGARFGANGPSSTTDYDTRLRPWKYRLNDSSGNSLMSEDFTYYADGRLQLLTDLNDTTGATPPSTLRLLSRGFGYDHVGRFTGSSGLGQGAGRIPYRQSYGYDEFGNMTSRSGDYYNYIGGQPAQGDAATYQNNRRDGWNYDADGRVTSSPQTNTDPARTLRYDAAGRLVQTVDTEQSSTLTYTAAHDGEGRVVYETKQGAFVPGNSVASYTLRMSALGGEALAGLTASGGREVTYVPGEGVVHARLRGTAAEWTLRDPLGLTESNRAVTDPLGNYIPFRQMNDPRPAPGSFSSLTVPGVGSTLTDPENYGMGCTMDGVPTNCSSVLRLYNAYGSWLHHPDRYVVLYPERDAAPVPRDYLPQDSRAGVLAFGPGRGQGTPAITLPREVVTVVASDPRNDPVSTVGGLIVAGRLLSLHPQNYSPPINIEGIRKEMARLLSNPACANFVKALIQDTSNLVGKDSPLVENGNVQKIFEKIVSQGGVVRAGQPGSLKDEGGARAFGSIEGKDATIQLGIYQGGKPSLEYVNQSDGLYALTETLHHAGERVFYDYDYARALNARGVPGFPTDPELLKYPKSEKGRWAFSNYFHPQVAAHCGGDKK